MTPTSAPHYIEGVKSLLRHPASVPSPGNRRLGYSFELQELWFSLMRRQWTSLALVPAGPEGSTMELARSVAEIGGRFRGAPLALLEGAHLDLESAAQLTMNVQNSAASWSQPARPLSVQNDPRTLVALESVLENPMGIPVALAADAIIVVVQRGSTSRRDAQRTLQVLGREQVLGVVLVG